MSDLINFANHVDDGIRQLKPVVDDDPFFILYMIMGMYLGPDIKDERPRKSVFQRRAEGLPPYTADQLQGSRLRTSQVEQIYYNLLKQADKTVVVKISTLRKFIEGNLTTAQGDGAAPISICPQFPDLFPCHLHPHSLSSNRFRLIANLVYIDKPESFFLKQKDIERFKRLTRLEGFPQIENAAKPANDVVHRIPRKRGAMPETDPLCNWSPKMQNLALVPTKRSLGLGYEPMDDGPAMVLVPSRTCVGELESMVACSDNAYALTGSAVKGQVGPVIGLMDVGESKDSYLFRVALPGVKREDGAFRCEVESDGKVLIVGETITGEKTVYRYTQAFEMLTNNLCPPGPFTISFRLPGPVDPRRFHGNFGTDGIMEGIVMKLGCSSTDT
ncbi:hypothetical protein Dimus_021722 [Dionaea muscipula]